MISAMIIVYPKRFVVLGYLIACLYNWGCTASTTRNDNSSWNDARVLYSHDQVQSDDTILASSDSSVDKSDPTLSEVEPPDAMVVPAIQLGSADNSRDDSRVPIQSDGADDSRVPIQLDGADSGRDSSQVSPLPVKLCDGTSELRLVIKGDMPNVEFSADGGNPFIKVLVENGGGTFLLDGHCQLYLQNLYWDPIRTLKLSPADEEKLIDELRIEEWFDFAGTYDDGRCTAGGGAWIPGALIRFIGRGGCDSLPTMSPPEPPDLFQIVFQAASDYSVAHYDEAVATSGPIRYTLFEKPILYEGEEYYRGGEPWPFGDPAPLVSIIGELEKVYVAEGTQAETLRALRQRLLSGEIGDNSRSVPAFIPIVQPDGSRYGLYMRDTTSFEDENGKLILPDEWYDTQ